MNLKILKSTAAVVALCASGMVNAATVQLIPSANPVDDGQSFTIDVGGIEFTEGVLAGNITITWDENILQLDSTLADITTSATSNSFPLTFAATNSLVPGQLDYNFSSFSTVTGPTLDFFMLSFTLPIDFAHI